MMSFNSPTGLNSLLFLTFPSRFARASSILTALSVVISSSSLAVCSSLISAPAMAYGVAITSSTGASLSGSFRQFEFGILDKIAASIKDRDIEPNSRLELVIDQSGKVVDAKFLSAPPAETVQSDTLSNLKALSFDPIPGIEQGTLALSFFFAELSSPPYKMNSLQIRSSGSVRTGDIDTSGPDIRNQIRSRVGEGAVPRRGGGNRISGPLQLGPPNIASALPPAGQHTQRSGTNEPVESIHDFRRLNYLLVVASANKRYDEAAKVHARIMELAKDANLTDKAGAVRSSLRWPGLAISANRVDDAKKAFAEALSVIDKFGEDAATVPTISALNTLSMRFASKNELGTADSGMRKSIDLGAIHVKNGASSERVSLAAPLKNLVSAYERQKDFDKAIELERYRLDKTKFAEPDNTAAIVVCQMDLAGVMLNAASANAANKDKYLDEANKVFSKALSDSEKAFGVESQEYKDTLARQISDYTAAGQADAAARLQKLR
ncbi:hypothetical protein KF728_22710 [Candidatus Obscuribacterales bacterium]|nr:hypothetical protein [Candidatus Obscuribacterales bacterium]